MNLAITCTCAGAGPVGLAVFGKAVSQVGLATLLLATSTLMQRGCDMLMEPYKWKVWLHRNKRGTPVGPWFLVDPACPVTPAGSNSPQLSFSGPLCYILEWHVPLWVSCQCGGNNKHTLLNRWCIWKWKNTLVWPVAPVTPVSPVRPAK